MQQFHVSAPAALQVATQVLSARLVCPLDGEYETHEYSNGELFWKSTAWPMDSRQPGYVGYTSKLMQWFRGIGVSLTVLDNTLVLDAELETAPSAKKKPLFLDFLKKAGGNSAETEKPPKGKRKTDSNVRSGSPRICVTSQELTNESTAIAVPQVTLSN